MLSVMTILSVKLCVVVLEVFLVGLSWDHDTGLKGLISWGCITLTGLHHQLHHQGCAIQTMRPATLHKAVLLLITVGTNICFSLKYQNASGSS
jgi:hypothetical protein